MDTVQFLSALLAVVAAGVVAMHDGTIETIDKLAHDLLAANLEELNVPGIYATRILVADRLKVAQLLEARPFDPLPEPTFGNITDGGKLTLESSHVRNSDEEPQS
jgi:hypothetical protein